MKPKRVSKTLDAFREMIIATALLIDAHIQWIKDNPQDAQLAQIHRQLLNLLMILSPSFELVPKLFAGKQLFKIESLDLYKKLYETAIANGDIKPLLEA